MQKENLIPDPRKFSPFPITRKIAERTLSNMVQDMSAAVQLAQLSMSVADPLLTNLMQTVSTSLPNGYGERYRQGFGIGYALLEYQAYANLSMLPQIMNTTVEAFIQTRKEATEQDPSTTQFVEKLMTQIAQEDPHFIAT